MSPTKPTQGPTVELRWAVWLLATMGILYQQIFHERYVAIPQLVISFELCNCNLRYKALETTFYVVIALLPSLAVYEMVRNNDFDYLKFLTFFFDPETLMS